MSTDDRDLISEAESIAALRLDPDRSLKPCGTYAAYQQHGKRDETPCAECRTAAAEYAAQYRRSSPTARENGRARKYARDRALGRLKAMHPGEYRALYAEEMGR